MKINELKLCQSDRGVGEILGLSPEIEVEYLESRSRWTGTGYKDEIYRIVGSDDAIIIHRNAYADFSGCSDTVEVKENYFSDRRNYAYICGRLARKYDVPFEVALVLGNREHLYPVVKDMRITHPEDTPGASWDYQYWYYTESENFKHELCCGIGRRKAALYEWLGEDLYNELKIDGMGQLNSERLARYIANLDETC